MLNIDVYRFKNHYTFVLYHAQYIYMKNKWIANRNENNACASNLILMNWSFHKNNYRFPLIHRCQCLHRLFLFSMTLLYEAFYYLNMFHCDERNFTLSLDSVAL